MLAYGKGEEQSNKEGFGCFKAYEIKLVAHTSSRVAGKKILKKPTSKIESGRSFSYW